MISGKVGNFFVKRPLLARSGPSMDPIRSLGISQVSYVRDEQPSPISFVLSATHLMRETACKLDETSLITRNLYVSIPKRLL
jgi:hypothetical protein